MLNNNSKRYWALELKRPLYLAFIIGSSFSAAFAQANLSREVQQIATSVQSSSGVPAVAIVAVNSAGAIGTGASGFRRAGVSDPIRIADAFHIGSTTKPITATMIAKLVEQGRLSWDSTPAQVFPEWRDQMDSTLRTITLAQILAHQAGIAPYTEEKELTALPHFVGGPRQQRRQFAKYLLTHKPAVMPGTQFLYSNAGYVLASAMAEKVMRTSWEALMKRYVFMPLKITSVRIGWPAKGKPDAPWGHERSGDRWVPSDPNGKYQLGPLLAPGGDLSMNAADLGQFLLTHLRGLSGQNGLLRAETVKKLHEQYSSLHEEALGWDLDDSISIKTGSAGTFFTLAVVAPKRDLAFAVLLNANDQKTAFDAAGIVMKTFTAKHPVATQASRLDSWR